MPVMSPYTELNSFGPISEDKSFVQILNKNQTPHKSRCCCGAHPGDFKTTVYY